jgi:hypothetical protein
MEKKIGSSLNVAAFVSCRKVRKCQEKICQPASKSPVSTDEEVKFE